MAALTPTAMVALGASKTLFDFSAQRANANAAEQAGAHEAAVYGVNAELARAQAQDAIARGRETEQKYLRSMRKLIGTQRAQAAASGGGLDGSALQLLQESQLVGEADLLRVRNNAMREAWGYQVEAANYDMRGDLASRAGRNTAQAMRRGSIGTLLSGAIETYGHYRVAKEK